MYLYKPISKFESLNLAPIVDALSDDVRLSYELFSVTGLAVRDPPDRFVVTSEEGNRAGFRNFVFEL